MIKIKNHFNVTIISVLGNNSPETPNMNTASLLELSLI